MITSQEKAKAIAKAESIQPMCGEPDSERLLRQYPKMRLSTAGDYYNALNDDDDNNPAVRHIEAGHEPYLISRESYDLGLEPFITVYTAVAIDMEPVGMHVYLDLHSGLIYVDANTLLMWN